VQKTIAKSTYMSQEIVFTILNDEPVVVRTRSSSSFSKSAKMNEERLGCNRLQYYRVGDDGKILEIPRNSSICDVPIQNGDSIYSIRYFYKYESNLYISGSTTKSCVA